MCMSNFSGESQTELISRKKIKKGSVKLIDLLSMIKNERNANCDYLQITTLLINFSVLFFLFEM